MTRRVTDIVTEGEALGKVAGILASVPAGLTTEQLQDAIAAFITDGGGVTVTYDDVAGSLTIAGGTVAVEDAGTEIVAAATRFDFTGAGVTVTDTGSGQASIAIPGSGASVLHGASAIRSSGTQAIATGTATAIQFNGESFDTDAFHDNTTNPERLTVPAGLAGYYQIIGTASVELLSNDKEITVEIGKNGAAQNITRQRLRIGGPAGTDTVNVQSSGLLSLAVGDYVTLLLTHNQGSSLNVQNATASLTMHLVGT